MHIYSINQSGLPLEDAKKALVMVHGRGSSARSMLMLADDLAVDGFAILAPQATNHAWYPKPFLMPREQNQPWLDSALDVLNRLDKEIEAAGIPPEDTYWLGFSQGACLMLEYAASKGRKYGGLFGLSGGLIGDSVEDVRYDAPLEDVPVILGCSDVDGHIPVERVHDTANVFKRLGASVQTTIYPGMGHTVNQDEIDQINAVIEKG